MKYLSEIARSIPKLAPKRCTHDKIPWRGDFIANGDDGRAYQNWDDETKVVKVGFMNTQSHSGTTLSQLEDNFDYVLNNKPKAYVEIFDYGCINCRSCDVSYYVLMEKLVKLDNTEHSVPGFAIGVQDYVRRHKKNKSDPYPVGRISIPGKKNRTQLETFARNIWDAGIIHNDIFYGNLMKTEDGDYKLIDLDRLTITNI